MSAMLTADEIRALRDEGFIVLKWKKYLDTIDTVSNAYKDRFVTRGVITRDEAVMCNIDKVPMLIQPIDSEDPETGHGIYVIKGVSPEFLFRTLARPKRTIEFLRIFLTITLAIRRGQITIAEVARQTGASVRETKEMVGLMDPIFTRPVPMPLSETTH